ncbi:putative reverse transcriptase domain-containing protein [Tanacetum coccineum]
MTNEIVARHGVPVSIISDRDGRFTSHLWQAFQEALGTRLYMKVQLTYPQTDVRVSDYSERGGGYAFEPVLPHKLKCAPFEALYWRKLDSPIIVLEVGESQLIGPEIVQETTEKIFQIKERLKTARSRQKSYADKRQPLEIVERDVKKLKRRRIPLVKVRWNSRQGAEYTWEREDQFRIKYPHLFSEPVPSSNVAT